MAQSIRLDCMIMPSYIITCLTCNQVGPIVRVPLQRGRDRMRLMNLIDLF